MTNTLLFLPRLGMGELLVILVVILLLFGAKRIPEVMKSFGEGIKSFKDGLADGPTTNNTDKSDTHKTDKPNADKPE